MWFSFLGFVFSSTAHPRFCPRWLLHGFQREMQRKWSEKLERFDTNHCGVASQSLPERCLGASASTVRSEQRRADEAGLWTPRGGKERSSCFMFISSQLTCPVFFFLPLRLIERLRGSFETFLRADADPVVWMWQLGGERCGMASCPLRTIPDCCAGMVHFCNIPFSSRTNQPFSKWLFLDIIWLLRWMLARGTCHRKSGFTKRLGIFRRKLLLFGLTLRHRNKVYDLNRKMWAGCHNSPTVEWNGGLDRSSSSFVLLPSLLVVLRLSFSPLKSNFYMLLEKRFKKIF